MKESTIELAEKKCEPCEGGIPPLEPELVELYLTKLTGWSHVRHHHITKEFKFKNFKQALEFVNKDGALAEEEGHHPDIFLAWGLVRIELWTHKIDGLHESDYILAAKIDYKIAG